MQELKCFYEQQNHLHAERKLLLAQQVEHHFEHRLLHFAADARNQILLRGRRRRGIGGPFILH